MLCLERWTSRLSRRGKRGERGQVMIMALIALTLGGLVVTPTLNHMVTGDKSAAIHEEYTGELYAADAGVEDAMWCIEHGTPCNSRITVDGILVDITVNPVTELPYGPVVTGGGVHADWLVISTTLVDEGSGVFRYTIEIQNTEGWPIQLEVIGAALPENFNYIGPCSGVTTDPPNIDGGRLTWTFEGASRPFLNGITSVSQTFQILGTGIPQGYFSWVRANREDVGVVSSCSAYNIVSQAGDGTTIEANVVNNEGVVFPVSWKIS